MLTSSEPNRLVSSSPEVCKGGPVVHVLIHYALDLVPARTDGDIRDVNVPRSGEEVGVIVTDRQDSIDRPKIGVVEGCPLISDLGGPECEVIAALTDYNVVNPNVAGVREEIRYTVAHREGSVYSHEPCQRDGWPADGNICRSHGKYVVVLTDMDVVYADILSSTEEICYSTAYMEHSVDAVEPGLLEGIPIREGLHWANLGDVLVSARDDVASANVPGPIEKVSGAHQSAETTFGSHGFGGVWGRIRGGESLDREDCLDEEGLVLGK